MKANRFSPTRGILVLLVALGSTSVGCKSTSWKMPGSSLFSWNREPDATTLAGTGPGVELPTSPASKYTPNTIASVGAQSPSASIGSGTNSSSPYGYTAQTVAAPKAGLAAMANGYQTGPYQVGNSASTPAGSPSTGLPNPYGGTYSGAAKTPDIKLPTSVSGAMAGSRAGVNYPAAPSAAAANIPVGYPTTASAGAAAPSSAPTYPSIPSAPAMPAYPALPTSTKPDAGTGAGSLTSAMPAPPASNASPGATLPSSYSPGTTGRSTNYDFSAGATAGSTGPKLPPNTASSSGVPAGSHPLLR